MVPRGVDTNGFVHVHVCKRQFDSFADFFFKIFKRPLIGGESRPIKISLKTRLVSENRVHQYQNTLHLACLQPTFHSWNVFMIYRKYECPKLTYRKNELSKKSFSKIPLTENYDSSKTFPTESWIDESDSGGRTSTSEWECLWRQTAADGFNFSRSTVDKILLSGFHWR